MKKVQRRKIKQKLLVYCVLLFVGDIKNLECFILKNYILPREKLLLFGSSIICENKNQ